MFDGVWQITDLNLDPCCRTIEFSRLSKKVSLVKTYGKIIKFTEFPGIVCWV